MTRKKFNQEHRYRAYINRINILEKKLLNLDISIDEIELVLIEIISLSAKYCRG